METKNLTSMLDPASTSTLNSTPTEKPSSPLSGAKAAKLGATKKKLKTPPKATQSTTRRELDTSLLSQKLPEFRVEQLVKDVVKFFAIRTDLDALWFVRCEFRTSGVGAWNSLAKEVREYIADNTLACMRDENWVRKHLKILGTGDRVWSWNAAARCLVMQCAFHFFYEAGDKFGGVS